MLNMDFPKGMPQAKEYLKMNNEILKKDLIK